MWQKAHNLYAISIGLAEESYSVFSGRVIFYMLLHRLGGSIPHMLSGRVTAYKLLAEFGRVAPHEICIRLS